MPLFYRRGKNEMPAQQCLSVLSTRAQAPLSAVRGDGEKWSQLRPMAPKHQAEGVSGESQLQGKERLG